MLPPYKFVCLSNSFHVLCFSWFTPVTFKEWSWAAGATSPGWPLSEKYLGICVLDTWNTRSSVRSHKYNYLSSDDQAWGHCNTSDVMWKVCDLHRGQIPRSCQYSSGLLHIFIVEGNAEFCLVVRENRCTLFPYKLTNSWSLSQYSLGDSGVWGPQVKRPLSQDVPVEGDLGPGRG